MSESIRIRVIGNPKGQPRGRACIRGRHAGIYDPGTADDWKGDIQRAARDHKPATPMLGPVRVDATFVFARPKSHRRKNGEVKPTAPAWHTSKPDRDNCEKCLLDALTSLGFWRDDSQVCRGEVRKRYTDDDESVEEPGAWIEIQEIEV